MKKKRIEPLTTADLITQHRLAKSRRLHAELLKREPAAAAKISPEQMFSRADLSKASGVNPVVVGRYERDEAKPGLENLKRLAAAMEVDPGELIGD